ncbi:MAG TPA: YraN family protein, partial [Burkholderiaceae bacterium]
MAGPLKPASPTAQQISGRAGEDAALAYLQEAGLQLVQRNFLCRGGEIDLVMRDGTALVFVEVRKRLDARYGGALASIGPRKQARLRLAAQLYLQRCRTLPACRF